MGSRSQIWAVTGLESGDCGRLFTYSHISAIPTKWPLQGTSPVATRQRRQFHD